jgi:hypothetical protein
MSDPADMTSVQRHTLADLIETEFRATTWALTPRSPRHLIVSIADITGIQL